MPHMHLRGTSAKYVATYPDGKTETLLSVPDYDFNWQSVYRFAEPLKIPKGTKLTWIGHWDNSADNPRNPDPTKEVRWGLQTWDEMQNGWMEVGVDEAEASDDSRRKPLARSSSQGASPCGFASATSTPTTDAPLPIPARIASNEEFIPPPQSPQQKEYEARARRHQRARPPSGRA